MRRHTIPNSWYPECWPDGTVMAARFDGQIQVGNAVLPPMPNAGDSLLFPRGTQFGGFALAGQSHHGTGNWQWRDGSWTRVGDSYGVNPVIFDAIGLLHQGAPQFGSQGFRFCDANNRIWTGDETYADPSRRIGEWTQHGEITVGFSGYNIVILVGHQRKLIATGGSFGPNSVRFNRDGRALAIAYHNQATLSSEFVWFDVGEIMSLPKEDVVVVPPPPPPPPPPPVMTPNIFDLVERVANTERGRELLTINTKASCTEFTQRVLALADETWGHVGKTAGEGQGQPVGWADVTVDGHRLTGVSYDCIFHKPTNQQVDIIGAGGANEPDGGGGIGTPVWGPVAQHDNRPHNPWVAKVPLQDAPPPPPPPPPPDDKLANRVTKLEATTAAFYTALDAFSEAQKATEKAVEDLRKAFDSLPPPEIPADVVRESTHEAHITVSWSNLGRVIKGALKRKEKP